MYKDLAEWPLQGLGFLALNENKIPQASLHNQGQKISYKKSIEQIHENNVQPQ